MRNDKYTTTLVIIFLVIVLIAIGGFIFIYISSNKNISNNIIESISNKPSAPSDNTNNIPSGNTNSNTVDYTPPIEVPKPVSEVLLAEYTTDVLDRQGNRIHNMTLANSKLTEHIVQPGEIFSFNGAVGPMGGDQGYKKATAFRANGTEYKEWGGGICQISSTLYNAVLIANLEVVERHPHSKRVYYVPKDKDATIYYGSLDFRFKNTTNKPIKIISSNDDTHMTVKLISLQ